MQSLLLSTLSIIDESDADDQSKQPENVASVPEQMGGDDTTNTMLLDSVTSNTLTARASNYDEGKKKQESASHSDLDPHSQHLPGRLFHSSHSLTILVMIYTKNLNVTK